MKVVLDTNVWLSGIFWIGKPHRIIQLAENRKFEAIVTRDILEELVRVLSRESKFHAFMENMKTSSEDLIRTVLSIATLVNTRRKILIIEEDPEDNKILEAAVDGRAEYIVSGDKHLLKLKEFVGIKILVPSEFLEIL